MAKEQLFDNGILDETISLDEEGNVIENTNGTQEDTNIPPVIAEGNIEIDDQGNVVEYDDDGKAIVPPAVETPDKSTEDKSKSGTTGDPSSNNDDSTNSAFAPFAKVLKEEGILPGLEITEETVYDAEFLRKSIDEQVKKNEFKDLNQDQKNVIDIMRANGDVSAYLEGYQKQRQTSADFSEITEDNAEAFLKEYWAARGLKQNEVDKVVDVAVINGKALEEAKSLEPDYKQHLEQNKTKQVENAKAQRDQEDLDSKAQTTQYKEYIDSIPEFIKGAKMEQSVKDEIYKLGTQAEITPESNGNKVTALQQAFLEDPIGTEAKLNYLYFVTGKLKNMDNLSYSKTAGSSALKELDEAIEQDRATGNSGSSKPDNNKNKSSITSAKFS